MDPATHMPRKSAVAPLLAGLQAGMLGVLAMLGWLGLSAKMQGRSFWTAENLMASAFFGDRALHNGFVQKTFSGLALYLLLYSALGALFAAVLSDRLPRVRILLLSVLYALGWYYLAFSVIWKSLAPLMVLLYSTQPMILGHLVYGTFLGQYPAHLPRPLVAPVAPPPARETAAEEPPASEPVAPEPQERNPAAPV
jgi:hypothetical protein